MRDVAGHINLIVDRRAINIVTHALAIFARRLPYLLDLLAT